MNKYIKTSFREFINENHYSTDTISELKGRAGTWSPKPLSAIIKDKICVFTGTLKDIFHAVNVKYENLVLQSQGTGYKYRNKITFKSSVRGGYTVEEFNKLEDIFKEFYGKGGFVDMVLGEDGREIVLEFDSKYRMSLYSDFPSGKSHPQGGASWNPHF